MSGKRFSGRRWLIATSITVVLALLGYLTLRAVERSFFARETLRETTATVIGKEHITFQGADPSYTDERGARIPVRSGDEQWRVYYKIDDFKGFDDSVRARLQEGEKELATSGHSRFEFKSREWHDKTEVGDTLKILYQWRGGDRIDVAYVENPKSPNLQ